MAMKIFFRRRPAEVFFSKENHQMKAGHNNEYDSTKTCSPACVGLLAGSSKRHRGNLIPSSSTHQNNGFKCQKDFLRYSSTS